MRKTMPIQRVHLITRSLLLIGVLFAFTLLLNLSVIQFNFVYPEQPLMYLANQRITSLSDLINVYLHPQMFHYTIPFFRPSGHFLIYQLITPIVGWDNQAFIIINLFFLALTGFFTIRLYALLFPRFIYGGYIAFSIYMMHPTLLLSRFISLHFEFIYVSLLMASLYYFVLFCRQNKLQTDTTPIEKNPTHIHHLYLFVAALFLYILATTFKEPAVMLGPLMGWFLLIYSRLSLKRFFLAYLTNRHLRSIMLILMTTSLSLATYLSLPWQTLQHPYQGTLQNPSFISIPKSFILYYLNLLTPIHHSRAGEPGIWLYQLSPLLAKITMCLLMANLLCAICLLFRDRSVNSRCYKRSAVFLLGAILLFLILPMGWGSGFPWHFSLAVLMLSMLSGFACDYVFTHYFRLNILIDSLCITIAIFIALQTFSVNTYAISEYTNDRYDRLAFQILHNAIHHPPNIRSQLNMDSLIVIEDDILKDPYVSGGAAIPPLAINENEHYSYNFVDPTRSKVFFIGLESTFNSSLFKWAYHLPTLREMTYGFSINYMKDVSNDMIYLWLQNIDNIFSFGYNTQGEWIDRTPLFKQNLLHEKIKRKMIVNHYTVTPYATFDGEIATSFNLPYPLSNHCEYQCDQRSDCAGFTYSDNFIGKKHIMKCNFYRVLTQATKPCLTCTSYAKQL